MGAGQVPQLFSNAIIFMKKVEERPAPRFHSTFSATRPHSKSLFCRLAFMMTFFFQKAFLIQILYSVFRATLTMSEAYSFSLTTFSPSGKLMQIEYALNAVKNGQPSVGLRGKQDFISKKNYSNLVMTSCCFFINLKFLNLINSNTIVRLTFEITFWKIKMCLDLK